ncbi:hypothetical protein VNO77_25628 [Canavalia gladiata]|uniref:Uncharacterized protein n=1 Tax=Canavalia gladiata TaxID=3824 RepID=A0AAN9LBV0_CANGL
MDHVQTYSSPQLLTSSTSNYGQPEECGVEGLATNIKLLLKLIQEHNGSDPKENDERKFHRVNGMMFILDEVRSRIQRIQCSTQRKAELRRCNTDLKPNMSGPKFKRPPDVPIDEKERLKRELNASLVARQSLQALCSSLGKEKQIMASELARKAQELTELEDFIGDLKAQNDMLLEKLREGSSEEKDKSNGVEIECNIVLQERNRALVEQLQKSIDGYRSLKRKFKEMLEENKEIHHTMMKMEMEVQSGIGRICSLKEGIVTNNLKTNDIKKEILALEHMLNSLHMKISIHMQKKI